MVVVVVVGGGVVVGVVVVVGGGVVVVVVVVVGGGVVVGGTSTPMNSMARKPASGASDNCTLVTPLAQAVSLGTLDEPALWKTWTRHSPVADATASTRVKQA